MKVLVIYDTNNSHHSYRMVQGLQACGHEVIVNDLGKHKYDYVFVEASYPYEVNLDSYDNVYLYDVEDDPNHFEPKEAYYQLLDKAKAYVKYNRTVDYLDFDDEYYGNSIKVICAPIVDYMWRGHHLANAAKHVIEKVNPILDAFFIGGPSYYSLGYTPPSGANHIDTERLRTAPENIWDPNRKGQRVYHQRLEWVAKIKTNSRLNFWGGLWFTNDNSNISLDFQKKQFGEGVADYQVNRVDENTLYNGLLNSRFGLCPTGFARSSFRLIELMALGKPILLTDDVKYKYLYNANTYVVIKDGENIDQVMISLKDDLTRLEKWSIENHKLFLELTPQKMWEDFLKQ
jgi:hypothetical protein